MAPPLLSGKQILKILTRSFGFAVSRQKGSHISLVRYVSNRKVVTVVPDHRQVARGTLRSILKLAEITEEDFVRNLDK